MVDLVSSLNVIDVAAPCSADWDAMTGDDQVRHCQQCDLNVYNLSEMSEKEALQLVNEREGQLCIQFYRRADGTMLTKDCPVGLQAIRKAVRQKLVRMWASAAALAGAVFTAGLFGRTAAGEDIKIKPVEVAPKVKQVPKGEISVTPNVLQIQLTYEGMKKTPAKTLKEYLRKCLAKEKQASYGMPDPMDKTVLAENVRQQWQRRVDDASYLPKPGSREHDDLAKQTSVLLKKHTDIALQIMAPQLPKHHAIRGKMMVRPDLLPIPE